MISLRAYARHRSVSLSAVQAAIASGRLVKSVTTDDKGRRKLVSYDQADKEWDENTRPSAQPSPPQQRSAKLRQPDNAYSAGESVDGGRPEVAVDGDDNEIDYAEARRRREIELWLQAQLKRKQDEMDWAERKGEVVPKDEARATMIEAYTRVKTKLLGVPTRARQRCQHLTADDVRLLDDLIREALEELADDGE